MKRFLLAAVQILAFVHGLVPFALRRTLLRGLFALESRIGEPRESLPHLFQIADDLDLFINERATALGRGVHPKHSLTRYHDFFVKNIPPGSRVLDLGCGVGEVAKSIAERVPGVEVTAIDLDATSLARASSPALSNLKILQADITALCLKETYDVIVLSNVLEHLDERSAFLRRAVQQSGASLVLVRVPLFERHWHLPMRRELVVSYMSDPTHRIEHSLADFDREIEQAGLRISERQTLWGEIWAKLIPA